MGNLAFQFQPLLVISQFLNQFSQPRDLLQLGLALALAVADSFNLLVFALDVLLKFLVKGVKRKQLLFCLFLLLLKPINLVFAVAQLIAL